MASAMSASFGIDDAFRRHGAEALATLIRLVGDFDLAEEGLQEAFAAAAVAWKTALPDNPRAWLIAVGAAARWISSAVGSPTARARNSSPSRPRSKRRRARRRSTRTPRRSATTTCCA